MDQKQADIPQDAVHAVKPPAAGTSGTTCVSPDAPRAFVPHVGWLSHEPGDELVSLLRQGYFEAGEQAFAWLYLRPGDWVFDCGAHIGLYTVIASRATGGGAHVFAVEPNEETARLLELNLAQNGATDARVFQSAIWNAPGTVRFHREAPTRSAYARVSLDPAEVHAVAEVPAITVDRLVELSGAPEIALVKLDVEGVELEALEGAASSIARGACAVWMVEFTEANLRRRGLSTADLASAFARHRLALHEFSPESLALVPFTLEGPVWFKNLFATRDLDRVNARLRSAAPDHVEVAQDILGRARACSRFKELEELDVTRSLAVSHEQWAKNAEGLLAGERELAAALRHRIEAAERRAEDAERRAEDAERRLRRIERWLMPWRVARKASGGKP